MYGDVNAAVPIDKPTPLGKDVDFPLYVNSDHAGEKFNRRSRMEFMIFLNMAPIFWFSKHHPTVESSVFGAEFVEMKNGIETARGLRYKL
jgi:hypothetical protein